MKYRIVYGTTRRYYRCNPGNEPDTEITKEEYDAANPSKIEDLLKSPILLAGHSTTCWPMVPEISMGVLPHQVEKAMEFDRKAGVPTEYVKTPDGYQANPVFTSRAHRKAYHAARGAHDNQGGYGD